MFFWIKVFEEILGIHIQVPQIKESQQIKLSTNIYYAKKFSALCYGGKGLVEILIFKNTKAMDILLKKYFDYLPKARIILLSLAVCGSRIQKGFHGCFWLNLLQLPSDRGQAETAGGWSFCKFFFLFLSLPPSYTSSPPSLSQSSLSSCSLKASPCGHSSWPTLHFPIPWQTQNSSFSYIVAQGSKSVSNQGRQKVPCPL